MSEENKTQDLETRVKGFNEKLMPLLGEFKLGLGAVAVLTNDGRIMARPHLIDDIPQTNKSEGSTDEKKEETKITESQ